MYNPFPAKEIIEQGILIPAFVEKDRGNMYNPSPAKEIIEQGICFFAL